METEVSRRKRLDGLPESSRYNSAEFCAPPAAPIETPAPANARISLRVFCRSENDAPQLSQHTDADEASELSQHSQRSFGSRRKLINGIQTSFGWSRKLIPGIQAGFGRNR